MELHQLRYFAKLAGCGNFTRAAEACHVSQPSLSQQIAKLERELGQPLFERLGRGARLTDAGRQFKDRVDQILSMVEDAKASVVDDPEAGRLAIAAIPTIAPYFLPKVLVRFASECPRARVEVVEETTANIIRLCSAGELDLAVIALPIHAESMRTEVLFTEELKVVMPANHPLAAKKKLALADLSGEPFVLLNEAHCLTNTTLSFCDRHAAAPVVTAQMHQLTTVQELVGLGHGISLIPEMAARADASPARVYRTIAGEKPTRTIALGWNAMRFQTKLFKRFAATVRACAREN